MKQELDYYAVLQVDQHAEEEVIQAAYRRLAARYHPDVNPSPGALEKMKLLNAAYEVLSDPEKRRIYDLRHAGRPWRPWWLFLVMVVVFLLMVVVIALAVRGTPRIILILGSLVLVLWLLWRLRSLASRICT